MVLLIGNYPLDRQQSMQRFANMMLNGLTSVGVTAELIQPEPFFGKIRIFGDFVSKWLGYIDKFCVFPRKLRRKISDSTEVVHICDHSNAIYSKRLRPMRTVVTCHDLLAVRSAVGEETDCPASFTGRILQRWILSGLHCTKMIACVSSATKRDAERLIAHVEGNASRIRLVPNGLNYPYKKLTPDLSRARLAGILDPTRPFILHVGSNLRRKNREGVVRIFALTKNDWNGQLVLAGDPLSSELQSLGENFGISDRILSVTNPESELLEALYSLAIALVYPSRFEGFGWPIVEAQACGCPVICSNREPMSVVGGNAALLHDAMDEAGFAADVLRLLNPVERALWSEKSLENAANYRADQMIARYIALYRELGAQV
jgi:glycosyltransferase involved in cell wall biosynthesis